MFVTILCFSHSIQPIQLLVMITILEMVQATYFSVVSIVLVLNRHFFTALEVMLLSVQQTVSTDRMQVSTVTYKVSEIC